MSPQTVQKWVDAGHLPAWKTMGGHRRLDAEAVERMVVDRHSLGASAGLSIVLVEDDPITAAVLEAQILELRPNARLRVFEDGFTALLDAGRDIPKLLITDVNLPGLDGLAMIGKLMQNPAVQGMRIVLATSHTDDELARFGPLPEGIPLLRKPITPQALDLVLGD